MNEQVPKLLDRLAGFERRLTVIVARLELGIRCEDEWIMLECGKSGVQVPGRTNLTVLQSLQYLLM